MLFSSLPATPKGTLRFLSVCLSVCPSVRPSVCPSVRLSVFQTFLKLSCIQAFLSFQGLVSNFNFHQFDKVTYDSKKIDPTKNKLENRAMDVFNVLFGAFSGDVTAVRRYYLLGIDMDIQDYDGRTALHLAASEGHLDVVKFLAEKCNCDPFSKDSSEPEPGLALMILQKSGIIPTSPVCPTYIGTLLNPGTARPGTRGGQTGGGVALSSQVTVVDRPMTQQGLGGMKTGIKGQRQVKDKTYFIGLIRGKVNELNAEMTKLKKDVEVGNEESSSFLTYEKRAETLASEIRDLQGELGDYNTLVDKLTTDEDIQDVEFDLNDLRANNEREAKKIEDLFEVKKQKEDQIKQLEQELDQEKRMADNMVNDMNPEMRQKYFKLKDANEHYLRQLERGQQELDVLTSKIENLNDELSMSQVKQEAVRLYEQLNELESKRDNLLEETKNKASPAEERERLLKQVKDDNQEIASLERQTNDIREKIESMQEESRQLDLDIEENQEFLNNFEESKTSEIQRIGQSEQNVVHLLEHMSRNMSRFNALPTPQELGTMKEDLDFKTGEMQKSEQTTVGLAAESDKLQQDLQKVEQLEEKINTELVMLKEKIANMERDLVTYSDLSTLKDDSEKKRRLGNLERKWQHHEQTNFVMKDFIGAKTMECDYRPILKRVYNSVAEYNTVLQNQMAGKPSV
ncbi:hypothetical protein FSP39_022257 [Pinctada imbricata]|uniref:Uncharacterized protein n=1 Tax=Pinctada imbricata TaxID=66713 RepID=A0AA89BQL6_PINIB|nr:hypothetical protein FSP39_022257 [Pinctada imbricata]